jgi:hypothetical protein
MKLTGGLDPKVKRQQRREWHEWFALWPVRINMKDGRYIYAWLEPVMRRDSSRYEWDFIEWEYKEMDNERHTQV